MKIMRYFALMLIFITQGCKKNPIKGSALTATVNVVNAIASDAANIKVNFTGKTVNYFGVIPHTYWETDGKGNSNGSICYGLETDIKIPVEIVMASDTLNPFFHEVKQFNRGDFYTLYLAGEPEAVDPVWIEENIPLRIDSTTGVRFVNLCKDCGAVNVNIAGASSGSFISSLPYKSVSEFMTLPANSNIDGYDFQITNPATGEELYYYTYWNLARMRNVTLVIRGRVNGDIFLEVVRINN